MDWCLEALPKQIDSWVVELCQLLIGVIPQANSINIHFKGLVQKLKKYIAQAMTSCSKIINIAS